MRIQLLIKVFTSTTMLHILVLYLPGIEVGRFTYCTLIIYSALRAGHFSDRNISAHLYFVLLQLDVNLIEGEPYNRLAL